MKVASLYKVIKELDGCNFSNVTLWEGPIESGETYSYHGGKTGIQYISEATYLGQISDAHYDFVISSNCLGHVALPLKGPGGMDQGSQKEWAVVHCPAQPGT